MDMGELDDDQLAGMAAKGDAAAFEALVLRHADRVFRMAWKWCGNRADAEDVTQEVFIKLAGKMHLFQPRAKFTTWLYQVTLNEARDHHRREARRSRNEAQYSAELQTDAMQESGADIEELLRGLPNDQREAVLLVHCQGLSHKEAALVLGCAEKTVTWRLFEARKKLKELHGHGR